MKQSQGERTFLSADIYPFQLFTLMTMVTICSNLFLGPPAAVQAAGRAAWLLVVLSLFAGLLLLSIMWGLARHFPDQSLPEYLPLLIGKWPGRALSLLYGINLIVNAAEDARTAVDAVHLLFFIFTPLQVTFLFFFAVAGYYAWGGHVRLARGSSLVLLVVLLVVVLVPVLNLTWFDLGYQRPWFDLRQWDPYRVEFWAALFLTRPLILIPLLYPHVQPRKAALPAAAAAVTVASLAVLIATVSPVAVLGIEGAKAVNRPFLFLSQVVRFADVPFERFDFLAGLGLLDNSLFTVGAMLWGAGRTLRLTLAPHGTDGPFIMGATAAAWGLQALVRRFVFARLLAHWVVIGVYLFGLVLGLLIPLAAWKNRRRRAGTARA